MTRHNKIAITMEIYTEASDTRLGMRCDGWQTASMAASPTAPASAGARGAPPVLLSQMPAGARWPGVPAGGRTAEISTASPHRSCRSKKPWTSRP